MPLGHFFHDQSLKVPFFLKKSIKVTFSLEKSIKVTFSSHKVTRSHFFPQKVTRSHFFQKIRPKIVEKPDEGQKKHTQKYNFVLLIHRLRTELS